jgi:hypothetical protein
MGPLRHGEFLLRTGTLLRLRRTRAVASPRFTLVLNLPTQHLAPSQRACHR